MVAKEIAEALLEWYDRSYRRLPWRIGPGSAARSDPYRVWLSEIMLQQTTVAAVIPYFAAFIERWPTVEALARADDGDVMAAWAGLGYYARARNLLACARCIVNDHGGRFPGSEAALRALPGIGTYTAAAIVAIGFGERAVVVDGNVERVVARLFAVADALPGAKPKLRALADGITPARRAGDFAQAMMDLGAGICRPKAPACALCPLTPNCHAATLGIAHDLPKRAIRLPRPVRFANAYLLRSGSDVMLVRREARGLLGGMLALPMSEFAATPQPCGTFAGAPLSIGWRHVPGEVRHVFTHFELRMAVFSAVVGSAERPSGEWVAARDISRCGLPTVFRKAALAALEDG